MTIKHLAVTFSLFFSVASAVSAQSVPPAVSGVATTGNDVQVARLDADLGSGDSSEKRASKPRQGESKPSGALEEVVVTAQKRTENLLEVPVPVAVVDAQSLINTNQLRIQDYYSTVPSLLLEPSQQSIQIIAIRGITTGTFGTPSVGITIDDVPIGSSTFLGGGQFVPDIDPNDLARVEVLRGPQGALYGTSSMGGVMKFVTVDTSTESTGGRIDAGTNKIHNGADFGYVARAAVNDAVSDTWAIRASGFVREDPGYLNNPVINVDAVNAVRAYGGRFATLWHPSDSFTLTLSALVQEILGAGSSDSWPAIGPLDQGYTFRYVDGYKPLNAYDRTLQLYSALATLKLSGVDVTSITGYNVNAMKDSWDYTSLLSGLAQSLFGANFPGSPVYDDTQTNKFSQEIRISSSSAQKLDWFLGLFYTHELSPYRQDLLAVDPATAEVAAIAFTVASRNTFEEYAAFANFTYHFSDRFDVQVGGRASHIRETLSEYQDGAYTPIFSAGVTPPHYFPEVETTASPVTYLVTPRLKLSPDFMIYARLASGYRAGAPNLSPGGPVPAEYQPDKTYNYELGAKGDFLNHTLSVDASAYYIDWKNIQQQGYNPVTGLSYLFNGGAAKSQGLELSVESHPLTGLALSGWVAFTDAVLTEGFPPATGVEGNPGDRLPLSSRFSGYLSAQQDFPLWDSAVGFVGADVSYVGDRKDAFTPVGTPRQDLPAYVKTDVRAGVNWGSWRVNAYMNNVMDKRGALQGVPPQITPQNQVVYIQPRTAGVVVTKTF